MQEKCRNLEAQKSNERDSFEIMNRYLNQWHSRPEFLQQSAVVVFFSPSIWLPIRTIACVPVPSVLSLLLVDFFEESRVVVEGESDSSSVPFENWPQTILHY